MGVKSKSKGQTKHHKSWNLCTGIWRGKRFSHRFSMLLLNRYEINICIRSLKQMRNLKLPTWRLHFYKVNRLNGQSTYDHQKKPTKQKSRNFESVFMVWLMPVAIDIYTRENSSLNLVRILVKLTRVSSIGKKTAIESTNYGIKFPHLSMDNLKLQLLTDVSFNNLSNGGSQAD